MSAEQQRFIGRASCCGRSVTLSLPADFWARFQPAYGINTLPGKCPEHGTTVNVVPVRGIVGARRCDSRCTSARNRDCCCQCAGANHGTDYDWREAAASGVSAVTR